jgi:drug/metabolite transporter (DMT)-like permease
MGAGQILFKLAALQLGPVPGVGPKLVAMIGSPYVWAAGLLYGSASLLWVLILTRVPLSVAYPLTSITMILVPAVSWMVFGDRWARGSSPACARSCSVSGR